MRRAYASGVFPPPQIDYAKLFSLCKPLLPAERLMTDDAIRCDACPVLCYIKPGRTGACDRYANADGQLIRVDPHIVLNRAVSRGESVVPFLDHDREWDGRIVKGPDTFVT